MLVQSQLFKMGWLKLAFLVAIAFTLGSTWKNDAEYMYMFRTRTLSGAEDGSNEFTGVFMKGHLHLAPKSDDTIMAKLSDVQTVQIHSHLYSSWQSNIPDSQLNYKPLSVSNKPFKIVIKNGIVDDVFVAENTPHWEVNMVKGIVSQIQLDTLGQNAIESKINQFPQEGNEFAVFKTMENSITGSIETLYEIKHLPEYLLETHPWRAPLPHLASGGKFLEVSKTRNYTNSEQRPSFNFGFNDNGNPMHQEPSSNTMGQYFLRTGNSRAVISGSPQRYVIQSVESINQVMLQTDLSNMLYGGVVNMFNLTLQNVQSSSSIPSEDPSLKSVGGLVYSFENRQRSSSSKEVTSDQSSEESASNSLGSPEDLQDKPKLNEPLRSPLVMQYFVAQQDSGARAAQAAKELAKQIGQELTQPERLEKSHTLDKHVLLTELLRVLDDKQIQAIANELYSTEQQGAAAKTWKNFRDAVAETGTGPAFLTIRFWIKNRKLSGSEAAYVVQRMARSVIQPTDEYIKAFFTMISQPEIENEDQLNVTAMFALSRLINEVYVHKSNSHNKYPVHNFGQFATNEGIEFVIKEYIPYIKQKLQNAVSRADNQKIFTYITAAGMIGHKKILEIYEPYLEGQQKITQYQRTFMVASLRVLAKSDPETARAVLYRIYSNSGEHENVRVSAVYNLMVTNPPVSMLQRMAMSTNHRANKQVAAAIISAITNAAHLRGRRYNALRVSARAALPLLALKKDGVQYSKSYTHNIENPELDTLYQQTLNWIGSDDQIIPKAIYYAWTSYTGGFSQPIAHLKAELSSVADLVDEIRDLIKDDEQRPSSSPGSEYTAENIAKILNIHPNEREELEGSLKYELNGLSGYYFFNNASIKNQLQELRRMEEKLRSGTKFHAFKIMNPYKLMVSFPMDMGFLFVYNLNKPILVQTDGQMVATAQPQLTDGQSFSIPHSANVDTTFKVTVARKVQARYGFFVPSDSHFYTAGSDTNLNLYVPLTIQAQADFKKQQINAEWQIQQPERNTRLFHISSYTYTSRHDVQQLKPILETGNTKIHNEKQVNDEKTYGKGVGMKLRVTKSWEEGKSDNCWNLNDIFKYRGLEKLINQIYQKPFDHRVYNIEYQGSESANRKMKVSLSMKTSTKLSENQKPSGQDSVDLASVAQAPKQPQERVNDIFKKVASGIRNPRVYVADAHVQFVGQNNAEYSGTFAVAASPVDEKGRALFLYRGQPAPQSGYEQQQVVIVGQGKFPNTNALNFEYAVKYDPTSEIEIHAGFGKDVQSGEKLLARIQMKKSERLVQSIMEELEFYRKHNKAEHGMDSVFPKTWSALTTRSNLMDRINVHLEYQQLSDQTKTFVQRLYDAVNEHIGKYKDVTYNRQGNEKEMKMEFEFSPTFSTANVSIGFSDRKIEYEDLPIASWCKPLVASHPVFAVNKRIMGYLLDHQNYRPSCVLDQEYMSTFDNLTYPAHLQNAWAVAFFYEPRISSDEQYHEQHQMRLQQLQKELQEEQYVVLVRSKSGSQEQREIKIQIRSPENSHKNVEIDMQPSGGKPSAKVTVNKQPQNYNDKEVTSIEQGFIELYALPNGETKLEIRNAFYIIYDGSRMKIVVTNNQFHGHLRGLCGTFTGEMVDDFTDPQNCIVGNPQQFLSEYTLSGDNTRGQQRSNNKECIKRDVIYGNYISERDSEKSEHHPSSGCYRHQTQYAEQPGGSQICFTVRSIPVCQRGCRMTKSITKSVQAHCLNKSHVTDLWKKQIDMGANPDFSQKKPNHSMKVVVPLKCSPTTY